MTEAVITQGMLYWKGGGLTSLGLSSGQSPGKGSWNLGISQTSSGTDLFT